MKIIRILKNIIFIITIVIIIFTVVIIIIIIIIITIIINSLFRIDKRTNIYNLHEMSKMAKNVFLNTYAKNK